MSEGAMIWVWTLDELAAQVSLALSELGLSQSSGRVREVPDRRTIRYYTTLGIVSRPSGFRGRTALYERSHLEQLVAIKRLQMKGFSLSQIQDQLLGKGVEEIAELAALPEGLWSPQEPEGSEEPKREQEVKAARKSFWRQAPAELVSREEESREEKSLAGVIQGVELGGGVKLLLESPLRGLESDDIEAIRMAAGPLLKVLYARNLLREGETE